MSNYDGKIELPQTYGNEQYLSFDKSDTYLWIAEENTKQAKKIERLQEQIKEANDVIISVAVMQRFPVNPELCREYLEK